MSNLKDFIGSSGFTDKQCQETHDGVVDLLLNINGITIPSGAILPFFDEDSKMSSNFVKYTPFKDNSLLKTSSDTTSFIFTDAPAGSHSHSQSGASYTAFSGVPPEPGAQTTSSGGEHSHPYELTELESDLPVGKKLKLIKAISDIDRLPINTGVFSDNLDILMKNNVDLKDFENNFIYINSETGDVSLDDYNTTGRTADTYNITKTIQQGSNGGNHTHSNHQVEYGASYYGLTSIGGAHSHNNISMNVDVQLHNLYLAIFVANKITKISNDIMILWDKSSVIPGGWAEVNGTNTTEDYSDLFIKATTDPNLVGTITTYSNYPNDSVVNSFTMDNNDFAHSHGRRSGINYNSNADEICYEKLSSTTAPHNHNLTAAQLGNFVRRTIGLALLKYQG